MRILHSIVPSLLLAAGAAQAASSWGFNDATLTVAAKKSEASFKEKFTEKSPLQKPVLLARSESLKLVITVQENGKGKRPHQALLVLQEPESGLEAPFLLTVKDSGKAIVEFKRTDLPTPLLESRKPLKASLVLASFGSTSGYKAPVFHVQVKPDDADPLYEKPLRYGKRDEIHHIFRDDPKNPPKVVSLLFSLAVLATLPALFIGWLALGGNVAHLSTALSNNPVAHATFFGSIVAMEGVFFLYYATWTLFQILPIVFVVGTCTVLSGTKALGEVQKRRLAGER